MDFFSVHDQKLEHISRASSQTDFKIRRHDFPSKSDARSRLLREIECRMKSTGARYSRDLYATYARPVPLAAFSFPFVPTISNAQRARNHLSPDLLRHVSTYTGGFIMRFLSRPRNTITLTYIFLSS